MRSRDIYFKYNYAKDQNFSLQAQEMDIWRFMNLLLLSIILIRVSTPKVLLIALQERVVATWSSDAYDLQLVVRSEVGCVSALILPFIKLPSIKDKRYFLEIEILIKLQRPANEQRKSSLITAHLIFDNRNQLIVDD